MKHNVVTDIGLEDSAYVCGAIVNARFNARLELSRNALLRNYYKMCY